MSSTEIHYRRGLPEGQARRASELYEEAFGAKFAVAVPNRGRRLALIEHGLCGEFSVCAFSGEQLVGLAGFQSAAGAFTGGITARDLLRQLGWWRGCRALLVFAFYERERQAGELLMDGICVDGDWRGHGIGSQLLARVADEARERGCDSVRLDVIDTNPAARRLYQRCGFVAQHTVHFGWLRWLFGFGASTTMQLALRPGQSAVAPAGATEEDVPKEQALPTRSKGAS